MLRSQRLHNDLNHFATLPFFNMEDDLEEPSSSSTAGGSGSGTRPRTQPANNQDSSVSPTVNPSLARGQGSTMPPSSTSSYPSYPALHPFSLLNTSQPHSGPNPSFPHTQIPGSSHAMGPSTHMPGVNPFAAYPDTHSLPPQFPPHLVMWPYMPQQPPSFNNPFPSNPPATEHFPHPAFSAGRRRSAGAQPVSPVASTSQSPPPTEAPPEQADLDPDESAILEDKRRRNTAASARFRIKKKQKSLNLERTVSDLSSRADELEREAANLRRENSWLKEMVIMKGRGRRKTNLQSKEVSTDSEEEDDGNSNSDSSDTTGEEGTKKGKRKAVARKGKEKGKGKGAKEKKGEK